VTIDERLPFGFCRERGLNGLDIESETLTIGDHDATTATAQVQWRPTSMAGLSTWMWLRVTIVKIGEEASIMFATALGDQEQLEAEGGLIKALNDIHDSIDVTSCRRIGALALGLPPPQPSEPGRSQPRNGTIHDAKIRMTAWVRAG
jgi:hypothetical protein